ncbi:MAG: SRPBCC domain-containing protein [Alphaproteobacteria bacterium]|nr:SRPBCC domain-containing protein [Alphaproteobacteria bacterium]
MPECEIDLRVGGAYRCVWEWVDGRMTATVVYREIAPEHRILCTEVFDIFPDNETLVEHVFSENDGKTNVTMHLHYDSQATRDGVLQSPMDEGLEACYCTLDTLIFEIV